MNLKNFFWFLKKPSDEREGELFNTAYVRSFKFIVLTLSIILVITAKTESTVPTQTLFFGILLLLFGTYMIGWFTLKNEEITDEKTLALSKKPLWLLYTLPVVFSLYTIIIVFLFSKTNDIIQLFIFGYSLMYFLLILYSFLITKPLPLYIRLILSLLWPLFAIFFITSKQYSHNKIKAGLGAVGYNFVIAFGFLAAVLILRIFIFSPFYSKTDYFKPTIQNGQYMMLNKVSKKYFTDDYIVFREDKEYRIGKIRGVTGHILTVETASGIITIHGNQIIGKIIQ